MKQLHSIDFDWIVAIPPFLERMAEYVLGALQNKSGKAGFMHFLLNITPDCDCLPWSDADFVPYIGILASKDPVALDHASYDLVNLQLGFKNSFLRGIRNQGKTSSKASGNSQMGCTWWSTQQRLV